MPQLTENLNKNFLANILHIFVPLNNAPNDMQHQPLVFGHQKPECIAVPVDNLLYKFAVIHNYNIRLQPEKNVAESYQIIFIRAGGRAFRFSCLAGSFSGNACQLAYSARHCQSAVKVTRFNKLPLQSLPVRTPTFPHF